MNNDDYVSALEDAVEAAADFEAFGDSYGGKNYRVLLIDAIKMVDKMRERHTDKQMWLPNV